MMTMATGINAPVTQIILWNFLPYKTVCGSSIKAFKINPAPVSRKIVPRIATEILNMNVVFTALELLGQYVFSCDAP